MKIQVYTQDGGKDGEMDLPEEVFGHKPNKELIHRMLVLQLGNQRRPIAHTLTKGEVRGGGKKPIRQKHTGNARQGSTRNPHWRGGGVAFGPRSTRNFVVAASKKERRAALFGALSGKAKDGIVAGLKDYTSPEAKTKTFAQMLKKLPFEKKILFVLPGKNELFTKSSRNIPRVKSILVNYLNIADILSYNNIVFVENSIKKLQEVFKPSH